MAGYLLGAAFHDAERWLNPVTWAAFGVMAGLYVWRVVRPPLRA